MIVRVLLAVILSGFAAGLVMGAMQHVRLTPLILEAETYEHVAHGHTGEAHNHGDQTWSPADGLERTFYTTLTAVISSVGFGLLMIGLAFTFKIPFTRQIGWIWGLCGFLAFSFAPAIGLPPELPGMPVADLNSRLLWWSACVGLTVIGLTSIYYAVNGPRRMAIGAIALAIPHVLFLPPTAADKATALSVHLATQFVTASLAANLVMWLVLGVVLGFALRKFESTIST